MRAADFDFMALQDVIVCLYVCYACFVIITGKPAVKLFQNIFIIIEGVKVAAYLNNPCTFLIDKAIILVVTFGWSLAIFLFTFQKLYHHLQRVKAT